LGNHFSYYLVYFSKSFYFSLYSSDAILFIFSLLSSRNIFVLVHHQTAASRRISPVL